MRKSLFILFVILVSCNVPKQKSTTNTKEDSIKNALAAKRIEDSLKTHWIFKKDTDQMRNIVNRFATLKSGDDIFSLCLRDKDNQVDIYICSNSDVFADADILCKFDNDSIQKINCGKAENRTALFLFGSPTTVEELKELKDDKEMLKIFTDQNKRIKTEQSQFVKNLKDHKKLIIEAHLYGKTEQSSFDITGLKW